MIAAALLLQAALTIGVPGPPGSVEYLALRLAQAEGHFAAEGLTVTLRPARAETAAAETMAQGRLDLAATSLDGAIKLGHVKGAPPRLVFGLSRAPAVALLVRATGAEEIRTPADLVGKKVGIPAPGTPEHTHLLSLLAHANVPAQRVQLESLGDARLAQAIASGAVAAGMIGEPWATRLLADGQARALADLRQPDGAKTWLGADTVHAAVWAPAESRLGAAELVALDRALLKAVARLRSAPAAELAERLGHAVTGEPADWAARLAAARGVLLPDGVVSAETLEASVKLLRQRTPLPAKVILPSDLGDLIAAEPLRKARGRRGEWQGEVSRWPCEVSRRRAERNGNAVETTAPGR